MQKTKDLKREMWRHLVRKKRHKQKIRVRTHSEMKRKLQNMRDEKKMRMQKQKICKQRCGDI